MDESILNKYVVLRQIFSDFDNFKKIVRNDNYIQTFCAVGSTDNGNELGFYWLRFELYLECICKIFSDDTILSKDYIRPRKLLDGHVPITKEHKEMIAKSQPIWHEFDLYTIEEFEATVDLLIFQLTKHLNAYYNLISDDESVIKTNTEKFKKLYNTVLEYSRFSREKFNYWYNEQKNKWNGTNGGILNGNSW